MSYEFKGTEETVPGYRVTKCGRVFSVSSNWRGYGEREMLQQNNFHGYPSVRLLVDGKRKRITVHRLVAAAFLPERPTPSHEIRHIDGNKENNHASNLAWGTAKENAEDRAKHGRTSTGLEHGIATSIGMGKAGYNPTPRQSNGR